MKSSVSTTLTCLFLAFQLNAQFLYEADKLAPSDRQQSDRYGVSVAVDGNYAVVGARNQQFDENGANPVLGAGCAYIYEKDAAGNWNQIQKIVASDRGVYDSFGDKVSIHGDFVIVGAPTEDDNELGNDSLNDAGSAYIFKRDASGIWNEWQKIVAPDREQGDNFGFAVDIADNFLIVSAHQEDDDVSGMNDISEAGSAYIFEKLPNGVWIFDGKIVAFDRQVESYFGYSASISGERAVVGCLINDLDENGALFIPGCGAIYIYERSGGGSWVLVKKGIASDAKFAALLGNSVSMEDDRIIAGASSESTDENDANFLGFAGAAYIWERDASGIWSEVQKIVASDRFQEDFFGFSTSISGDRLVVGAVQESEDVNGQNSLPLAGSAYIFNRDDDGHWSESQKIVPSNRFQSGLFAQSVSISENTVFSGAPGDSTDATGSNPILDAGATYIFEAECPFSPPSLVTSNIISAGNASKATGTWNPVPGAISYTLTGGSGPPSTWATLSGITGTSYTANNLTEGATYTWSVQANCAQSNTIFSGNSIFTIPICATPTNPQVLVAGSSATFSWDIMPGAIGYIFETAQANTSYALGTQHTLSPGTTNIYTLPFETAGNYKWRVRSGCNVTPPRASPFTADQFFTISGKSLNPNETAFNLVVYPNPSEGILFVSADDDINRIRIVDLNGRELISEGPFKSKGSVELNLEDLEPSVYIVQVFIQGEIFTEKVILD